jgi:malonate decarboxylase beta subunit
MSLSLESLVSSLPLTPRLPAGQGSRGAAWLEALSVNGVHSVLGVPSVLCAQVALGDEEALGFAVVPDPESRLERASHGEMGLEQSLALAACLQAVIAEDKIHGNRRTLLAIVDTPGQALGRFEETHCISFACAAAVEAYAQARREGHPVLTLVAGGAFSGSFLSHGMQADYIVALAGKGVSMQAMTARSIARITRRTLAEVESTAARVMPMSYAIADAHRLGIIDELLSVSADSTGNSEREHVREALRHHLQSIRAGRTERGDLRDNPYRAATVQVRHGMRKQWLAADELLQAQKTIA